MSDPTTLTEHTFTHTNNHTTFYWSAGPTSGPLLIFVHGWVGNGLTWKPQLTAFAALGFHTIAPDTRGYGRSLLSEPFNPHHYSLEHHVSDLRALLAHLSRPKAIWIGHDWGAGLVWALAAHHPELCAGVACMAVPYRTVEFGMQRMVELSNRAIYPRDEMPLAQWDYMAYHVEQPERSARTLGANVANTVKLLFRRGSPERYGQPAALTTNMRAQGGWFGELDEAPDSPFEDSLLSGDRALYDRLVDELGRNGFAAPNAYYRNDDANRAYTEKAVNGGFLRFPVLFIEARWDANCATSLSRLSEPMREYCTNLTECSIEAGHTVAMEKPQETNATIVRWVAEKLPTYYPGYWKTPLVSRM